MSENYYENLNPEQKKVVDWFTETANDNFLKKTIQNATGFRPSNEDLEGISISLITGRKIKIQEIDYFLPHLSSEFFRIKVSEALSEANIPIPQEKWFTNLTEVGNVGAASAYLILEELFHSGKLKKGDKLLLMVPESSRFSYAYSLLTVC